MRSRNLEQKGSIRILFYLNSREEATITEIMKELELSQQPAYKAKDILILLGLVKERLATEPMRRMYSLTDRGRRAAAKLAELETVLGEEKEKVSNT